MNAKEIIKKAQTECGDYATGYKQDINGNTIREICKMMWTRAKNLSYNFGEWHREITTIIGMKQYQYWMNEIMDYQQEMMNANNYFVHHGQRFCA